MRVVPARRKMDKNIAIAIGVDEAGERRNGKSSRLIGWVTSSE